jgi:phthiocerol/phenolphthiocerol synthesis type-I polyketide synthase C
MGAGISIVGYACRLPGAANAGEFWRLLCEGRSSISKIPADRFATVRYIHPNRSVPGKSVNFYAGVLDDIFGFDAAFFGVSPREAVQTDPQQRLLLQVVWESLEHAGIPPSSLAGLPVGVFVGTSSWDYQFNFILDPLTIDTQTMTGNTLSIVSNRISYLLDLRGPSFTVDTACSSSLVALNQACEAVSSGLIDTAIVAGVHLLGAPFPFIGFSRAFMLSAKGRCSAFDAEGDGYVRGEGAVAIVIQATKTARRQNRNIHGRIVGWGTNQDGRTVGMSMPSSDSQHALLQKVYGRFDLDPADLAFVEAHGTGTRVGDPAEASSIGRALGVKRKPPLSIGSVKTNIGHLEPASGLAGLLKAVLSLKHGVFPASLHFKTPNPDIPFGDLNLAVAATPQPFQNARLDLAGVNSFGFGGSNAHVVLQRHCEAPERRSARKVAPLAISARTPEALRVVAARLAEDIEKPGAAPLSAFCNEAAYGRDHLECRAVILPSDRAEMLGALKAIAVGQSDIRAVLGKAKSRHAKVAFAFSGNGSQWPGMGRTAFSQTAEFRRSLKYVDSLFSKFNDWSLIETLHSEALPELLNTASIAQGLLFAIQVGLVNTLRDFGIEPCVVVGHSVGEVAAAWASGALELEQAVTVIHSRSTCQETLRGKGGMAAVMLSREEVDELFCLDDYAGLEIAAVNTGRSITISGAHKDLDVFMKHAREQRWPVRRLDMDYPYHSHFADPVEQELRVSLRDLSCSPTQVPFVSSVYGRELEGQNLHATYWWKNVRNTVNFKAAIETALTHEPDLIIEIGPTPILTRYISDITQQEGVNVPALPTLERKELENVDPVLKAAMTAFVHGASVSMDTIFGPRVRTGLELPNYPWQNVQYRVQPSSELLTPMCEAVHPLLGVAPRKDALTYFNHIDTEVFPWLKDHRIENAVVFPGAAILEIALAAAKEVLGQGPLELRGCAIFKPLVLEDGVVREIMTRVSREESLIDLLSRPRGSSEEWVHHARSRFCRAPLVPAAAVADARTADSVAKGETVYRIVEAFGFGYGPAFRRVEFVTLFGPSASLIHFSPEPSIGVEFLLDPTIVDSALHGTLFTLFSQSEQRLDGTSFVPTRIDSLSLYQPGRAVRSCRVEVSSKGTGSASADLTFLAEDNSVVAIAQGGHFAEVRLSAGATPAHFYRTVVVPLPHERRSSLADIAAEGIMSVLERLGLVRSERPAPGDVRLMIEAASRAVSYHAIREAYGLGSFTLSSSGSDQIMKRIILDLAADGLAEPHGDCWKLRAEDELPALSQLIQTLLTCDPERAPEATYLSFMAAALPEILLGREPPAVSSSLSEALETASASSSACRYAFEKLIGSLVATTKQGQSVSVLVVGSGDTTLIRSLAERIPVSGGRLVVSDFRADRLNRVRGCAEQGNVKIVPWERLHSDTATKFDLVIGVELLNQMSHPQVELSRLCSLLLEEGAITLLEPAPGIFLDLQQLAARHAPAFQVSTEAIQELLGKAGFGSPIDRRIAVVAGAGSKLGSMLAAQFELRSNANAQASWSGSNGGNGLDLHTEAAFADEVVVLADLPPADDPSPWILERTEALSRALQLFNKGRNGTVWLVAPGAVQGYGVHLSIRPECSALWGFARVASNEYPNVELRLIDISPSLSSSEAASRLSYEIALRRPERELLIDQDATWGLRLYKDPNLSVASGSKSLDANSRLEIEMPGSLDRLQWQRVPRECPSPGQVEIQVTATGLNFRDVMWALGLLPPEALESGFAGPTLGMECSGVVTRVGAGVSGFVPGDRCVAFARAAFSEYVLVPDFAIAKLQEALRPETAASIPVAFLTAYYSLKHLAQLKAGETVLVHGGAGGVGLAAIQIAKWRGAVPIATAGSPEKQALLHALGVDHVLHSRSVAFADEIRAITAGQGVDVVLNSLAGEAMERSIECLKPFGRFIELGKRDFFADTRLGLRPFRRNLSYFGVDADQLLICHRELARTLFAELLELFERDELKPLPYRVFDGDDVTTAFRLMQQAGHVGKIIVRPASGASFARGKAPALQLRADQTYLIAGGFGGFGVALAQRLAARGARNIVLIGRSGARQPEAKQALEDLRSRGVNVREELVDAADAVAMTDAVARVSAEMPPINGIFHAAMVLDDALIENLTPARIEPVLRAKIGSARVLDQLSKKMQLDWFVMFSSATTVVGNPGQASYVAANAYLEGLAQLRRANGLPALTVGWGAISNAGYLARSSQTNDLLTKRLGKHSLRVEEALDALEHVMLLNLDVAYSAVTFSRFDWGVIGKQLPIASTPWLEFVHEQSSTEVVSETGVALAEELLTLPADKARERLIEILATEIGKILRIPAPQIDRTKPLSDIGLDSLMGVELKLSAEERLGFEVPLMSIGGAGSISDLAGRIVTQARGKGAGAAVSKVEELVYIHSDSKERAAEEIAGIEAAIEQKESSQRRVFE